MERKYKLVKLLILTGTVMEIKPTLKKQLLQYQKNEITEYFIYKKIAETTTVQHNKDVLLKIAEEEKKHYSEWEKYTKQKVEPSKFRIFFFYWVARLFGFTFSIKLMERGEKDAQHNYSLLVGQVPEIETILNEEGIHEEELIEILDEERLKYAGSVVLGLNDALVELLGTLAGLTFALQNSKLIALSTSIVGIAAALSMGSSEYLQSRTEKTEKKPLKAAFVTTFAYLVTVVVLLLPYFLIGNFYVSLAGALISAVIIIVVFNYYISVVHDEHFTKRFLEMLIVSLSVAVISFLFGYAVRFFYGGSI